MVDPYIIDDSGIKIIPEVGTMKLVRRLVLTKNTPMILKAKLDIKLKVIMSPFISRLLLGQKSVASYWKMGR